MNKKAIGVILLGLTSVTLTGCQDVEATLFNPSNKNDELDKFDLKKEVVLDHYKEGKYGVTFKKIKKTDKRNSFASNEINEVFLVDYEFQNYSINENILLYEGSDFKFFDSKGNQLSSYPLTQSLKYANPASIGEISSATIAIGSKEPLDKLYIVIYNNELPVGYIKYDINK